MVNVLAKADELEFELGEEDISDYIAGQQGGAEPKKKKQQRKR